MNRPRMICFKNTWFNMDSITRISISTVGDKGCLYLRFTQDKDNEYQFIYGNYHITKESMLASFLEARDDMFKILKLVYNCEIIKFDEDTYIFNFDDENTQLKIDI